MDKVVAPRLRSWERWKLHSMKRRLSNTVNNRHARKILLSTGGVCNREIADRVDCPPVWVRRILRRLDEGGIDAIWW